MSDDTIEIVKGLYNGVDAYIASLPGWDLDIAQLVAGRSESIQLSVTTNDYLYLYINHKLKLLHNAVQVMPFVSFTIPLNDNPVTFLDQSVGAPIIFSSPFGETNTFITPNNFRGVVFSVSDKKINDLLDFQYDSPVRWPKATGHTLYYPSAIQLTMLQTLLAEVKRRLCELEVVTQEDLRWLQTFSDNKVLPLICSIMANSDDLLSSLRPRVFRSALTMIYDNLDSPPSIAEMAKTLGVTTRTIQYLFMNHLGMTPKAFISNARLNIARRHLRHSDFGNGKISEIANNLGYWHMGNFSQEFKKLFQLTPGDFYLAHNELEFAGYGEFKLVLSS